MALTRKRVGKRYHRGYTLDMSGGGGGRPGMHMAKKAVGRPTRKVPSKDDYDKSIKDLEDRIKKTQDKIVDLLLDEEFEKPAEGQLAPIL